MAAAQPGDLLDCVDITTWQGGRRQQRYRAPVLRSRAAVPECVITSARNGVAPACSIEPSLTAVQSSAFLSTGF
jgi:hypothetical protein